IYFPSYEIIMDELRDYRFYAEDMLHPNQTAIDYIWMKFSENFIDEIEFDTMQHISEIQKSLRHRPFNPNSESHLKFQDKLKQKINSIVAKYPEMKF
ncbi:MAG: GSCFA domain-containing protein, partial [Flavobacterium sp.]